MQQKECRYYSIIGISLLLASAACEEQIDYRVQSDWIYINETPRTIELPYRRGGDIISITPMDTFVIIQSSEGPEDATEDNYVPPLEGIPTRYGTDQCLLYDEEEGPFGTASYESKKLEDRYYEFTYRFTKAEFAEAEACE